MPVAANEHDKAENPREKVDAPMPEDHGKRPQTFWQKARPILEGMSLITGISGITLASLIGIIWAYVKHWIGYELFWWLVGSVVLIAAIIPLWRRPRATHAPDNYHPETIATDDIRKGIGVEPSGSATEANPVASGPLAKEDSPVEEPADTPKLESPPAVPPPVVEPEPLGIPEQEPNRPQEPTSPPRPPIHATAPKPPDPINLDMDLIFWRTANFFDGTDTERMRLNCRFDRIDDTITNVRLDCPDCGRNLSILSNPEMTAPYHKSMLSCLCGFRAFVEPAPREFYRAIMQAIHRLLTGGSW